MQYPVLQLKPKREKAIVQRHPWIFSGALAKPVAAEEGDIVEVQSNDGKVLGYGFFSSKSQISCRMFEWNDVAPDFETADYWQQKISRALFLRQSLVVTSRTNVYRLIHAEGDFLPGLIVDVYGNVAVAQILIKGIEKRKAVLQQALYALGFENVFVKAKSSSHVLEDIEAQSGWLSGEFASPVTVLEHNLAFEVDFIEGQKTGFFIDQRENRQLLRYLSQGKKVLNTFSYTGGFSIYALAGGATEVHSVDISADALKVCDRNVELNFPGSTNHKSITADCFSFLKDMPADEYDIIVLDPPAFAKHARAVDNASRGYKQINLQAFRRIKPGGILFTFSCSGNISKELFQKIVFGAAADAHRNVRIIKQLHQPADHPINIYHPEGEYLKGLVLWVE